MKNWLLVILSLALAGCINYGSGSGPLAWWEISGVVTYEGSPVQNNEVFLEKLERSCAFFCKKQAYRLGPFYTDNSGAFRINGSLPGEYVVVGLYDKNPACIKVVDVGRIYSGKRVIDMKINSSNCEIVI